MFWRQYWFMSASLLCIIVAVVLTQVSFSNKKVRYLKPVVLVLFAATILTNLFKWFFTQLPSFYYEDYNYFNPLNYSSFFSDCLRTLL